MCTTLFKEMIWLLRQANTWKSRLSQQLSLDKCFGVVSSLISEKCFYLYPQKFRSARSPPSRKHGREVVGCRNSGKFLKKFFKNQRLFQWLFVKSTKISDKNLNIWNFSEFLQKWKIFVNKNAIEMENIKVPPIDKFFQWHFSAPF